MEPDRVARQPKEALASYDASKVGLDWLLTRSHRHWAALYVALLA